MFSKLTPASKRPEILEIDSIMSPVRTAAALVLEGQLLWRRTGTGLLSSNVQRTSSISLPQHQHHPIKITDTGARPVRDISEVM